jgi:hypothetical protein
VINKHDHQFSSLVIRVCSITHGAILLAVTTGFPSPVAREEPIAPGAAIPAATNDNEQNKAS